MQTYNKLFDKLCSYENLFLAYKKARKGKTGKGYVIKFEENLEENYLTQSIKKRKRPSGESENQIYKKLYEEIKQEILEKQAIDSAINSDWKTAIKYNKKIIASDKKNLDSYLRLGFAYLQSRDLVNAKKYYKKATK